MLRFATQQAPRDLPGGQKGRIGFVLLVMVKRRENPLFLEIFVHLDVGYSVVEMAESWFLCD